MLPGVAATDESSRFDRCRCVLAAALEGAPVGAPPTPIAYRRCPVGVIADLDCPEYAGARCNYFVDRGLHAPDVIPRTEVPLLAAELAADYLTPRYRRRIVALRGVGAGCGGVVAGAALGPPPRVASSAAPPVNVPADPVGRSR